MDSVTKSFSVLQKSNAVWPTLNWNLETWSFCCRCIGSISLSVWYSDFQIKVWTYLKFLNRCMNCWGFQGDDCSHPLSSHWVLNQMRSKKWKKIYGSKYKLLLVILELTSYGLYLWSDLPKIILNSLLMLKSRSRESCASRSMVISSSDTPSPHTHNWERGAEASMLFLCTVSETQKVLSQASPSSLLPCYPLDG